MDSFVLLSTLNIYKYVTPQLKLKWDGRAAKTWVQPILGSNIETLARTNSVLISSFYGYKISKNPVMLSHVLLFWLQAVQENMISCSDGGILMSGSDALSIHNIVSFNGWVGIQQAKSLDRTHQPTL